MSKLPTWKQKTKKPAGKRFGSNLAPGAEKRRKIDEIQVPDSLGLRIRLLSDSEVSDPDTSVAGVSDAKESEYVGSGPTPSVPELVSIVTAQSPAKPCEEEGEDSAIYRELQELLDEPTPLGSKESLNTPGISNPKVGMNLKKVKKTGLRSKIGDQRSYTYDEVIECQEKLFDSDDFQFRIDDVEKNV